MSKKDFSIRKSSTAEYFAKNLQQVGFSSPVKAVLTTLKESVDNSLDACESADICPCLWVEVKKIGQGSSRNTDLIQIAVEDNGPGLDIKNIPQVFGEYLASSKFGRGQCSRGQQGIGISAATTWAQLTNARGVKVLSKTASMRKALSCTVDVDIKSNLGVLKNKENKSWEQPHGVRVEFCVDGRVQLRGDGGLRTYLEGTTLVNPHLTLNYKLLEEDWQHIEALSDKVPYMPPPVLPHPHTMKLGEFITHTSLYGRIALSKFLKTGFSRITDHIIRQFIKAGLKKSHLTKSLHQLHEEDYKVIFRAIQNTELMAPSTKSVLTVGEEALSKSIRRLGNIDFFSVVTRRPRICDFKPVVVEVALARLANNKTESADEPVRLLRFANRVPLQFDKSSCAITRSIESVNWRTYGFNQPKKSLPQGPYVFAVSVVSPFIKFKNASKETIDSSEELVDEIRKAAIQAGQRLSRHIRRERKEEDILRKVQHIEQFVPILVQGLARIVKANQQREKRAETGLRLLLQRESKKDSKSLSKMKSLEQKLIDKTPHLKVAQNKQTTIQDEHFVTQRNQTNQAPQGVKRSIKNAPSKKKGRKRKTTSSQGGGQTQLNLQSKTMADVKVRTKTKSKIKAKVKMKVKTKARGKSKKKIQKKGRVKK